MYIDIGGYDMAFCEFKEKCRKTWSERFNCFCFDVIKHKSVKYIVLSVEAKTRSLKPS